MKEKISVALAGNPNAGKTTLFNFLTGARQHVGNYPGITVDRKEGIAYHQSEEIALTDLPGTYSLTAYSVEELVARDFILNEKPKVVINIVDASNLERNLYLTTQLLELGVPTVIALNMMDVAKERGLEINHTLLQELTGIPVVPIVARSGKGLEQLLETTIEVARQTNPAQAATISYGEDIDQALSHLIDQIETASFLTEIYPSAFTAIKYLEHDEQIIAKGKQTNQEISDDLLNVEHDLSRHLQDTLHTDPESMIADHRYGFIKSIIRQGVVTSTFDSKRLYASDKIDQVLTNRLVGPVIMLTILMGIYQFTFSWSEVPVGWLETLFGWLGDLVDNSLPDGLLKSLIISGVIDGVGGVLGFVPLIMFMFFGIAILEDTGYLARVAYMMDRIFRVFGLHGSSVMPFIVSGGIAGGCAVPGVMATRTLRSPKERMATLLTVPFMNCGAKLPVLALLIGAFFSENKAQYMFLFTILAWVCAMATAKLFRATVLRGEPTPFVMELPPYRLPTFRGLIIHTWERTYQYIKKAGTVILGISILLWALMTYPGLPEERRAYFESQQQQIAATLPQDTIGKADSKEEEMSAEALLVHSQLAELADQMSQESLQNSIAGKIGSFLEPVSRLAGFDWRTNIALIGGFAAKEVIVSTLGTAYSLGEVNVDESDSLGQRLKNDNNWNRVVAIAALLFIMFYAPCFVTIVCIAREASWRWAAFSMTFNTVFAFVLATLVFQIGSLAGLS